MQKKYWLAIVLVGIVGVSVYWYWNRTPDRPRDDTKITINVRPGGVEESEVVEPIEPIVVDRGHGPRPEPMPDDGPMPVVRLEAGMTQPPRPDAELAPQMPFADDDDVLGLRRNPVSAILDPKFARLNIFDGLEESEETAPLPDYHHHQCPYHNGRHPGR